MVDESVEWWDPYLEFEMAPDKAAELEYLMVEQWGGLSVDE